ncbi:MAG: polyprenyl diphosphate synthase [Candidatus Micrarchaeota archaeon]|nr:polyprenyl diphosphate synthase [Candidatus Micrarchaeota archaeon]
MSHTKPFHVAFIPDGNRRWARRHRMTKEKGYSIGIGNFGSALKWGRKHGIRMMSFWAFSTENAMRDRSELNTLNRLFEKNLKEALENPDFSKYEVRMRILGRRDFFPWKIRQMLAKVEDETRNHDKYFVNLFVGYGGRNEIADACNKMISDAKTGKISKVDEKSVSNYLYTRGIPDPDLIIRTSGEMRLSGFLPWQGAYSEFYFSKKLWPDFKEKDFALALKEFARRKRRFGK